jgi:hypothetical protein
VTGIQHFNSQFPDQWYTVPDTGGGGGGGSPPPAHYEASQLRLVHTRKNILVCSARWIYDLKTKISSECSLNW